MKERIREVREHFGLSMEKFGARIGIGKTSISLLESGKNNPSVQTVALICREFGVSEHWLRTGEGEMFEQTRETVLDRLAAEYSLDKEQVSVIENFLDLSRRSARCSLHRCARSLAGLPHSRPAGWMCPTMWPLPLSTCRTR